jgi:DNA (cytosine-5)-methyltransferase 1
MKDYPAHLDAMWQKHLAPREPNAPTVISTFAGAGGSSLGYSMAGYRELLAVEWDDNAVETFKLNFPGVPVYHGDIAELSVDECLSMAGISQGELDILDGSPPCQGFSTAGKRIMDDPRNQLFREFVRLLRGLRPKVFVMENVSGMVKGKMKLVFVDILKELKASGYQVSARLSECDVFSRPAKSGQRMIFIGVRDDLGIKPSHPGAEARPVTVGEAIDNCQAVQDAPAWRKFNLDLWNRQRPGDNGIGGKYFNHVRMDFRKPSPTIPKSAVFGGFAGLYNETSPRSLNLGELRRIGSYPDGFRFIGNYESGLNRIGNSVPPLMAEAIARHIRQEILERT